MCLQQTPQTKRVQKTPRLDTNEEKNIAYENTKWEGKPTFVVPTDCIKGT